MLEEAIEIIILNGHLPAATPGRGRASDINNNAKKMVHSYLPVVTSQARKHKTYNNPAIFLLREDFLGEKKVIQCNISSIHPSLHRQKPCPRRAQVMCIKTNDRACY